MFEDKNMFKTTGGPANEERNVYHLAHMVSLLGRPPVDFLMRSHLDTSSSYFDGAGETFSTFPLAISPHSLPQEIGLARQTFRMIAWKSRKRTWRERIKSDFYSLFEKC